MASLLGQTRIETDVLVVGGGAAGAMAAIRARQAGAATLMIVKAPFPSGSSAMARSGFSAALGYADPRDNPEVHYRDTLAVGTINDPVLAKVMCDQIVPLALEMAEWGMELGTGEDGKWLQHMAQNFSYPRMIGNYDETGRAVMRPLAKKAKDLGVEVMGSTMLVDLIVDDGRVVGAIALNPVQGQLLEIRTGRGVVLAAGGAAQLFPHSDTPKYQTGDAQAAAWRAGAEMRDIEFAEFQLSCCNPGLSGYPPASTMWITLGGRLYNAAHERFMKKYGPKIEKESRSLINRAVSLEVFEGRGTREGGVYLDVTHLTREEMMGYSPTIVEHLAKGGVDLTWQPMQVACGCHSFLGGIRINPDGSTSLPGLYAGGEVTGGVHGADRLGGNALTNALVFGHVAGAAAASAEVVKGSGAASEAAVARALDDLEAVSRRSDGVEPRAVIAEIKQTMAGAQVVRSEESLAQVLRLLGTIAEERIPAMGAAGETRAQQLSKLVGVLEARNLAVVGRLVATAASIRKESRGFQYRLDFPEQDDANWLKGIVLYPVGEGIGHRFVEPRGA